MSQSSRLCSVLQARGCSVLQARRLKFPPSRVRCFKHGLKLVAIALLLCSCGTRKAETISHFSDTTQTAISARADSVAVTHEKTDSVIVRDSIFTIIRGDTVLIREYHYRERNNSDRLTAYKSSSDTILKIRTITVTKTVTVTKEIEKPLSPFRRILLIVGSLAVIAVILIVATKISVLIRRR